MIKHPINFAVGIFSLLCFIFNIVKGRDTFTIYLIAIATALNITFGLI